MTWILVYVTFYVRVISMQEFNTEDACKSAGKQIEQIMTKIGASSSFVCVPKG